LVAGLLGAVAVDSSLMVDGDRLTVVPNEWELTALFAHHFVLPDTAARVAKLRGYMFGSDLRRGPFIDIVTINRVVLGEREPSWALAELLVRTAADPHHTIGRLYAAEVEAALADRDFVAWNPGVAALQRDYVSIWNANVEVADPGDLPLALARTRALLASRGVETFTGAYPVERPVPATVAAMMPLAMPFERGTEIVCMQGNNSMAARSSHGPDQLRYALDLNAPKLTTLVASASGTAYVYAHGRPASFDNYGFGNLLLIDLHNGFALLYAHLTTFAVNNGQDVTAGQIVGTVGLTGAVANNPHVHLQVVPLFRTPDPVHEEYQSDTPIEGPFPAPFGVPEQFSLSAIDVTAGATTGTVIESTAFACGESGRLPGAAHVYRVP
jgi:murein DD-endopeptidase MepM/ murein hydrolase activator NlpD